MIIRYLNSKLIIELVLNFKCVNEQNNGEYLQL